MPKTREYEFDVSIETPNLPDVGTPTDPNDILTKEYADDTFALLEDWGNDVADITALRAVAPADRNDAQIVTVQGLNTLYMFNASSALADDGDNVIQPDTGTGRWLKTGAAGGASGSFSCLALDQDNRVAKKLMGLEDNTVQHKRKRFHVFASYTHGEETEWLNDNDTEGTDNAVRKVYLVDNDTQFSGVTDGNTYLGYKAFLYKNEKRMFFSKKGENYFGIIFDAASTLCDSVTVTIDGVAINDASLGLINERGEPWLTTDFSSAEGQTFYQKGVWFFGLDETKQQTIIVENTDSGVKKMDWCAIEVGYATNPSEMAITYDDINVSAGRAIVCGQDVQIGEFSPTFTASSGYGKKSITASNTSGTTRVVEGSEGAFTITKPGVTVSPGNTTLEVKNSYFFPSKGIFALQLPYGQTIIGSYTGKTESSPNTHTLTGVIYKSDFEDFTPLDTFNGAVGTFNSAISIYLLADGTENAVEVDSSNNKLDFTIGVDGAAAAQFTATIPSGLYAADIMPLGDAIAQAMQSAKALERNSYFCEYSEKNHLWTIGVKGSEEVDSLSIDFQTGPNGSDNLDTSINNEIGFGDSDQSGALTYLGTVEKESMAWRCFERGEWYDVGHPMTKMQDAPAYSSNIMPGNLLAKGLLMQRTAAGDEDNIYKIYTPHDCCGIEFTVAAQNSGAVISAEIDKREKVFMYQSDYPNGETSNPRGHLMTQTLTFPVGTHEIIIKMENSDEFELGVTTNIFTITGHRVLYPKPPLERLQANEAALSAYIIRPLKLMDEYYQHDYSGSVGKLTGSGIDKSGGTWGTLIGDWLGNSYANSSTVTNFMDVTFTLDGNGGGIGVQSGISGTQADDVEFFITTGATGTSNAVNLIDRSSNRASWTQQHSGGFSLLGLTAGQYTLRVRFSGGSNYGISGFRIYDTTVSEENVYYNQGTTDNLRTAAYPALGWGSKIIGLGSVDGIPDLPNYLGRSAYKDGDVHYDIRLPSPDNLDDTTGVPVVRDSIWRNQILFDSGVGGATIGTFDICESMFAAWALIGGSSTQVRNEFDGVNTPIYNPNLYVKNGTSASSAHRLYGPLAVMDFNRKGTGDMSSSTTFVISDTTAIREGQKIVITADGQPDEIRRVDTVTLNTSFTINKAIAGFANYTTANNVRVRFPGFHRLRSTFIDASTVHMNAFGFLPLPVRPSEFKRFDDSDLMIADLGYVGLSNGSDMPIPLYPDGTLATWGETMFSILSKGAGGYDFRKGFRDIVASAPIYLKLKSIRKRK